jgi:hypothetical protein
MLRRLILTMLIVTLSAHVLAAPDERVALAQKLTAHGVAPDEAQARVAALTDEEATELAATIEAAPAGGNKGVLAMLAGAAMVAAVVLLAPFVIAGGLVYLAVKGSRAAG